MEVSTALTKQVDVKIRPGVYRPYWSAVTKPRDREALGGRMAERAGLLDRWSHRLEADEDTVWRTTLLLYGGSARSPSFGEIAVAAGILPDRVATIMRKLQSHDLVVLDTDSDSIRLAYPFTETATGNRVELNGKALHALCAIDALGVANMYSADTSISSP